MDQAGLKSAGTDGAQLIFVVDEAAASSSHCIGGAKDDRIAELIRDPERFLHGVSYFASRHFNSETVHGLFKLNSVFSALNSIDLNADDFYAVFIKNSFFI